MTFTRPTVSSSKVILTECVLFDVWYSLHHSKRSLSDCPAAVAKAYPGNKLLSHRGNALTHDLDLGRATLSALCQATSPTSRAEIPRYDKSAFSGKGDRFPREEWRVVTGRVDVVLFEGWMLGFQPEEDDARVAALDKDLIPINEALKRYDSGNIQMMMWAVVLLVGSRKITVC